MSVESERLNAQAALRGIARFTDKVPPSKMQYFQLILSNPNSSLAEIRNVASDIAVIKATVTY